MVAQPNAALALINQQIMWNRLIAVVEEQAQTMLRTAFSTPVREAGDLSAGVFDRQGRMLAQAVTGTPGHVNSMANAVRHFLDVYPLVVMKPGDHFITNDPWLTSGHLHDITVVSPSFYRGEARPAYSPTRSMSWISAASGMGPWTAGRVFEEGLAIPIIQCRPRGPYERGFAASRARQCARTVAGCGRHTYACAACNDEWQPYAADRDDGRIRRLPISTGLARQSSTHRARRRSPAFAALPHGTYRNSLTMDGYDKPLVLNAALTISEEGIHVDFDGTSPASSYKMASNGPKAVRRRGSPLRVWKRSSRDAFSLVCVPKLERLACR